MTTPPPPWVSPEYQPQRNPPQQFGPPMSPPQWSQQGGYTPPAPIPPEQFGPEPQPAARARWFQRRGPRFLIAAAVVLIAVIVIVSNRNSTFTLKGQLTLYATGNGTTGYCSGSGGYSDLTQGATVTVYNSAGSIIGSGALSPGYSTGPGSCMFDFRVQSVPGGSDFYQVEVSHRGRITLSSEEATSGNFAASIGH
jgi:hypothetical protein